MSEGNRVNSARAVIKTQLEELNKLVQQAQNSGNYKLGFERLRRWKKRTVNILRENVHDNEGNRLEAKKKTIRMGDPLGNLADESEMYAGFLQALDQELADHPEDVIYVPTTADEDNADIIIPKHPNTGTIFIVHGHDELNLLRLKELIRDRWKLEPLVLSSEPGRGRTIIEKFEQEAQRAAFAFVLLTPDDVVETGDGSYFQARPNVTFELGWFYGRLGRDRVCILFKKGTNIHSDLDGISRVQFNQAVDEVVPKLERELIEANVLKSPKDK